MLALWSQNMVLLSFMQNTGGPLGPSLALARPPRPAEN